MKDFRILALVTILALAFALSVQAQTQIETETTTTATQSSETQTTDQTAPTVDQQVPAASPDTSMSDQSTTSNTVVLPDITVNPDPDNKFSDTEGQSNTPIDYSKNPYWPPQDWGYINNNESAGGGS